MSRIRVSKPNRSTWDAHNDRVVVAFGHARKQDRAPRKAAAVTAVIPRVASDVQSDLKESEGKRRPEPRI